MTTRYFQIPHSVSISSGARFRAGIARVERHADAVLLAKAKGVVEVTNEVEARRNFREAGGQPKPRGRFFKVGYRIALHPSGKSFLPGVHEVEDPDLIAGLLKAKGVEEVSEAQQDNEAALFSAIDKLLDAEQNTAAFRAEKEQAEARAKANEEKRKAEADAKAAEEEAKRAEEEAKRAAAEAKAMEEAAAEKAVSKKFEPGGEVPAAPAAPKLEPGEEVVKSDPPKKSGKGKKKSK